MNVRSAFISSTAKSIEPSCPRSALPLPQTVTKVTIATVMKLMQMEVVTKKCSMALATFFSGGRSISTNEVSVKPAMIAACVPTAEKLSLKSLSSFSRNSIERCFTFDCKSSLSAASMLRTPRAARQRGKPREQEVRRAA